MLAIIEFQFLLPSTHPPWRTKATLENRADLRGRGRLGAGIACGDEEASDYDRVAEYTHVRPLGCSLSDAAMGLTMLARGPSMRRHAVSHSITSSARARSVGGIVRPSALAVLKLTAKLKRSACSTGSSAGFLPFTILST